MAKSIFDHLKGITKDKVKWESLSEDDKKSWDDYMITRWLSMNDGYIDLLNDLQVLRSGNLASREYYNMLLYSLPAKSSYVKYIKKPRTLESKKQLLEFLGSVYKVSKRECLDMVDLFNKLQLNNEFEDIMIKCGLQENEKEVLRKEMFDDN